MFQNSVGRCLAHIQQAIHIAAHDMTLGTNEIQNPLLVAFDRANQCLCMIFAGIPVGQRNFECIARYLNLGL